MKYVLIVHLCDIVDVKIFFYKLGQIKLDKFDSHKAKNNLEFEIEGLNVICTWSSIC